MVYFLFLGLGFCKKKGILYIEFVEYSGLFFWKVGVVDEGLKLGMSWMG